MKRVICSLFLGAVVSFFVSVSALAAGINSAEQRLLNTVSEPFVYNGKTYAVTDGSIQSARARLSQEGTDLTDGLANDCISRFNQSHAELVDGGYCRELDPVKDKGDAEKTPAPTSEPEHTKSEQRQNKAFLKQILGEPKADQDASDAGKNPAKKNQEKEQPEEGKEEPAYTAVPSPAPEKTEDVWDVEGDASALMDFDSRDVKNAVKGKLTVTGENKKYTLKPQKENVFILQYIGRYRGFWERVYLFLLAVTGVDVLLLGIHIFCGRKRRGRKRRIIPAILTGVCVAGWSLLLIFAFSLHFGVFHKGVVSRQLMESDYFSGVAQMAEKQAAKRLKDNGYDTGIAEEAFALSNIYIDQKQYTDDVLSGKRNARISVDKVHEKLTQRLDQHKDAVLIELLEEDYINISKFDIGSKIRTCRDFCRGIFFLTVLSGFAACVLLFLLSGCMYRHFYKAAGIGAAGIFPVSAGTVVAAAMAEYMAEGWKIQIKPVYYQTFLKNYISQDILVVFCFGCIGIMCAAGLVICRHHLHKAYG